MYSTQEAAQLLGISVRRVNALINSGDLLAQKFGSSWMIDEASVEARRSSLKSSGRPKLGAKDPSKIDRYTLMNKNHAVLNFSYYSRNGTVGDIEPLQDVAYAPPGACVKPGNPVASYLGEWIRNRYIPSLRPHLAAVLRELGVEHQSDLLFKSFGLNLSDQYWFKPLSAQLDWQAINYFDNDYEDTLGRSLNQEPLIVSTAKWASPSSGTPGLLPKWWERREGRSYLVKAGSYLGLEPYNELLATKLYQRLLEPEDFLPYWIEEKQGYAFSVCPDMVGRDEELVSMQDIMSCYQYNYLKSPYEGYVSICKSIGLTDIETSLAKMIACDFLTANPDRHQQNLGVIRAVESLEYRCVAPIFDNGRSFYADARTAEELEKGLYLYTSQPFSEYPLTQLAYVADFEWYEPQRLRGFDEIIVETLQGNPSLPAPMAQAVARQFNLRVERLNEYARQFRPYLVS